MIPLWLAALIVIGASNGIILLILLIGYGYIGILKLKDKVGKRNEIHKNERQDL